MKNRIRYFRERARLTQAEIATLLGTDETSVSRWENGSRSLTPQIIEKLSRLFKCQSWELLVDRKGLRRLMESDVMPESENEKRRTAKVDLSNAEKGHHAI